MGWISLLLLLFILLVPSCSIFPSIRTPFEVSTWRAPPPLWLFAGTLYVTFLWMAAAAPAPHGQTGAGLWRASERHWAAGGRMIWEVGIRWPSPFCSEDQTSKHVKVPLQRWRIYPNRPFKVHFDKVSIIPVSINRNNRYIWIYVQWNGFLPTTVVIS